MFDSLLILDLFLHLEGLFGEAVSLDEVASCSTIDELDRLLSAMARRVKTKIPR